MRKGQRFPIETLTPDEVRALLRQCSTRSTTGTRNMALIVVLYRSGLRISEALALLQKDLDAATNTIRVLHGKGDRSRVVALDTGAWAVLQRWMDRRAALGFGGRVPVFSTLKGESMKRSYVAAMLKRLAAKAGIEKRVHPHGLRHTHSFELASEGVPVHEIQAQLGHSSLATTDRYVRHLNPVARIERMRARDWSL